jgi:hypothetical protein
MAVSKQDRDCHVALHEDYDKLSLQLAHFQPNEPAISEADKKQATEYFQIRP